MNLIVAVTADWGIGYRGGLVCSVREDMQFFRRTTLNKVVIMGRRTLESFPGGKPLKNRVNLVLTENPDYTAEGAMIFHSPEAVLEKVKEYPAEDVFVIGGAAVYAQFLPMCRYAYVTKLQTRREADRFFPNLDAMPDWVLESEGEMQQSGEVRFCFCRYENRKVQVL